MAGLFTRLKLRVGRKLGARLLTRLGPEGIIDFALRTGPLSYVLATAELHRKHHALDEPALSGNYGTNLILWDIVFGTFKRPREETTDVGLFGQPAFPHTYFAQLARPFSPRPER